MGLLSALKNRLFPPALCRLAKRGEAPAIVKHLSQVTVVVLGADIGTGVSYIPTEDALELMVETAAQKKSFDNDVLKYDYDGETFLPIFTDETAAQKFCGSYCSLLEQIHAFRLFAVPGSYIGAWMGHGDILVINPQSDNEVEIDSTDTNLIRSQLPTQNDFGHARFLALVFPMHGVSKTIEFKPAS